MTIRLRIILGCALVAGLMAGAAASGQTPLRTSATNPEQPFSQGVQTYFSGQTSRADDLLSQALAVDPGDARAFYFRGLARLRMGRGQEAATDMQIGAALEAQQPGRFAMGRTLERVQGGDRLILERYRREGALATASAREQKARTRYEHVAQREAEVLHHPASIAIDQLLAGGQQPILRIERRTPPTPAWSMASLRPVPTESANSATDDPFPDDPVASPTSAPERRSAADSPVLAAPPVPATGVGDNPFDAPAPARAFSPSVANPPPAAPATPASDNPFENPFGG